jgi:hypothetical protein
MYVVAYDAGRSTGLMEHPADQTVQRAVRVVAFVDVSVVEVVGGFDNASAVTGPPVTGSPPVGTTIGRCNVLPVGAVATGITG